MSCTKSFIIFFSLYTFVLCVFVSTLNLANSKYVDSNKCNRPFTDVYLTLMHMSVGCVYERTGAREHEVKKKKDFHKHLLASTKQTKSIDYFQCRFRRSDSFLFLLSSTLCLIRLRNGFFMFVFLNRSQSTISLEIVFFSCNFFFCSFYESLFVSLPWL